MSARNLRRAKHVLTQTPYKRLKWRARCALLLIADRTNDKDRYWQSRRSLGEAMGCSAKTAGRAVRDLEDLGFLVRIGTDTFWVDNYDAESPDSPGGYPPGLRTYWTLVYELMPGIEDRADAKSPFSVLAAEPSTDAFGPIDVAAIRETDLGNPPRVTDAHLRDNDGQTWVAEGHTSPDNLKELK